MAVDTTPVSEMISYPTAIFPPKAGTSVQSADVASGEEALANRTAYLKDRVDNGSIGIKLGRQITWYDGSGTPIPNAFILADTSTARLKGNWTGDAAYSITYEAGSLIGGTTRLLNLTLASSSVLISTSTEVRGVYVLPDTCQLEGNGTNGFGISGKVALANGLLVTTTSGGVTWAGGYTWTGALTYNGTSGTRATVFFGQFCDVSFDPSASLSGTIATSTATTFNFGLSNVLHSAGIVTLSGSNFTLDAATTFFFNGNVTHNGDTTLVGPVHRASSSHNAVIELRALAWGASSITLPGDYQEVLQAPTGLSADVTYTLNTPAAPCAFDVVSGNRTGETHDFKISDPMGAPLATWSHTTVLTTRRCVRFVWDGTDWYSSVSGNVL